MELVAIGQELWRRRIALAIAFFVALLAGMSVLYHLPSLKKKSLSYGSATTQFLLDSNRSSLGNASTDLTGLATRAAVFTRFMTSPEVQSAVARHAGVPAARLSVDAPVDPGGPQGSTQPPAERRSSQLAAEADRYRVFVQNEQALPVVDVYAQAPDAPSAVKLADAAVRGMQDTLARMRSELPIATASQLRIDQLGPARGSEVTQNGSKLLALAVFVLVFAVGCVAIVLGSRLVEEWRLTQPGAPRSKPPKDKSGPAAAKRRAAAKGRAVAKAADMARAGAGKASGIAAATRGKAARVPKQRAKVAPRGNGGPPLITQPPTARDAFTKPGRAGSGRANGARERHNGR
jgi:hypothetical protein